MHSGLCRSICAAAVLIPALAAQTASPPGLQQQIDQLRTQVKSLQTELDQIKNTLREQSARANPVFSTAGYPSRGDLKARVVVLEFSDFQCPYCLEFFKTAYPQLISAYVNSGKARYVFADFPGESIHPEALKSAMAGRCALEQGKFWEMHDQLFQRQRDLGGTGISDAAGAVGLDITRFEACVKNDKVSADVRATAQTVSALGLRGTPAIVLGIPDPADPTKVKLARAFIGAQPFAVYQQAIDGLLANQGH